MLSTKWFAPTLLVGAMFNASVVYAENEQGTGDSCICVIGLGGDGNGALVMQVDDGKTKAIGRSVDENGYSEFILDGINDQGVDIGWGKAEVSASCNLADVVLYQKVDDGYKEILATQITTDYCPR